MAAAADRRNSGDIGTVEESICAASCQGRLKIPGAGICGVQSCNISAWEAEVGGAGVLGQPGLLRLCLRNWGKRIEAAGWRRP